MSKKKKPTISDTFESAKADYEMNKQSRFVRRRTGLAPQGSGADYHIRSESQYYESIEKCRDMDRNDAVVGQIVDRAVANVVQDGFTLEPQTGDKRLDRALWDLWQEFADDPDECDIGGEMCWHDFERLGFRSHLVDGDSFATVTQDGPLQFIEAHSIQTSTKKDNTFCGITTNQYRRRETFWYRADNIDPNRVSKAEEVPLAARDQDGNRIVFQVCNTKRALMTRGVSAFAPVFYLTGMFEDIQFAKVVQQQVVSCFAIFRELAAGAPSTPPSVNGYGQQEPTGAVSGIRTIEGIGPGMEVTGNPGEVIKGFSPNVPNNEYFAHVKLMLTLIGVNLGLPLCLVLMDGSETNFSGWRGAVDEARKGFRQNQRMLVKRLHRPVYEAKVRQWMESNAALKAAAARRGVNIFKHEWNVPEWRYINPLQDAQADAVQLQNCLTSPRRLHAGRGLDWELIAEETVKDNVYAITVAKKAAQKLNLQFPDDPKVHWRELLPIVMASNTQLSLQDPQVVQTQAKTAEEGAV
jgi:lambda family phage portal protein